MKKEMLRIHELNMEYSATVKLMDISMCLMAGECIGFLGLVNSGKNLLVDILCGHYGTFQDKLYIDGKRNLDLEDIHKSVYRMVPLNYLIDNWTVAEYICLVPNLSFLGIIRRKQLVKKADLLIKELSLDLEANKKLKNLSELEKRLVDLIKAYSIGIKLLVIEDEFEGCSTQDIIQFKDVLDELIQNRMVVIINSNSDTVSKILSDKYIIFKKGYIVKKCSKHFIQNSSHLEKFLLGTTITTKKKNLDEYQNEQIPLKEVIYSVKNIYLTDREEIHFDFYKGEIVSILSLNVKEKKQVFDLLSGRVIDKDLRMELEHNTCHFDDICAFVRSKIVSVADMGGKDELLLGMSAGLNLLVPSMEKIPATQYVFSENKLIKLLKREVRDNIVESGDTIRDMNTNDYIILLLERWYVYKPKVLILFEPFIHCDIYSVSLVKSYIKKFAGLGTTVIIVKSREENIVDISDRIISMD